MAAFTARHETRALLRAHLAAASAYRHLTRHCAVCHRLLRLAMEPGDPGHVGEPGGDGGGNEAGDGGGDRSGDGGGERAGAERPAAT
ncbi:DUF6274 family protein [Streptomyces sp. NPDC048142]|uniref:DUF6274 family protein n=1 Tax=Streptomyces sp. NPDC048142 TaxID=3365501 RepID=UPI0037227A36